MNRRNLKIAVNTKTFVLTLLFIAISGLTFTACKKDNGGSDSESTSAWKYGDIYLDNEKWTECIVGNMPLIISVPHGGQLTPAAVPDRSCAGITTVTDGSTIELAKEISKALKSQYNVEPYIVICHLKRTKIDQNREIEEATCGNKEVEAPWHRFHHYIDTALANAVKQYGAAIYIDLHGHGHDKQRLELGYSLSANELNNVFYDQPNVTTLWRKSTLQNSPAIKDAAGFREYITGEKSFGARIEAKGFNAVPSLNDPFPQPGDNFFNGGYNSRRYTSATYPKVFGWQIESNFTGVRSAAGRPLFAKAFAGVIIEYLQESMNYKP